MILQEWMQLFVKNKDVGETKIVKYFTQSSLIIIPRTTTDAHNKRLWQSQQKKFTEEVLKAHSQVWDKFWQLKALQKLWKMPFI